MDLLGLARKNPTSASAESPTLYPRDSPTERDEPMIESSSHTYQSKTKPYNIRLTREVHAAAAAKAELEGTSVAKVIDALLAGYVDGTLTIG